MWHHGNFTKITYTIFTQFSPVQEVTVPREQGFEFRKQTSIMFSDLCWCPSWVKGGREAIFMPTPGDDFLAWYQGEVKLCPQVPLDEFGTHISFSDACRIWWLFGWLGTVMHCAFLWASLAVRLSSCRPHCHLCRPVEKINDLPIRFQGLTNISSIFLASCLPLLRL